MTQRLKIILAYATIYLVWGSTFLAIRIGVHEVPPLLLAALRFFTAGLILFVYTLSRREPLPTKRQWISIAILAALIFLADYGILFWAEQRVPSGIAAVMLATIPAFTALAEIPLLHTRRLTLSLAIALVLGLFGVAILTVPTAQLGVSGIDVPAALALLLAAATWSLASALTRRLDLPASKATSSAAQMLLGGFMLFLTSAIFGEFHRFDPASVTRAAWLALAYLIFAGSLLGFTTYLWLLHRESPTRVATYAYVNPLVAVLLGYFFVDEPLGPRTLLGSAFVLLSVVVITAAPASPKAAPLGNKAPGISLAGEN